MAVNEEREQWLSYRKKGIGGTDIGSILGLSPFTDPIEVFRGKTESTAPQQPTEGMEWGSALESLIADRFKRRTNTEDLLTGLDIAKVFPHRAASWDGHTIIEHQTYDYLLGTPDGFAPRSQRGLEVKNVGYKREEWGRQGSDEIPAHYLVQCAWYMAVTGVKVWDVAVLFSGNRLELFELHRDAELEKSLIDAGRQFWNDHVLTKVPPKIDGTLSWSHYLGRRFALEKKPAIEATEEIASWAIVLLRAVVLYIEVAQQPSAEAS